MPSFDLNPGGYSHQPMPVIQHEASVRASFLSKTYMFLTAGILGCLLLSYYITTLAAGQQLIRAMVSSTGTYLLCFLLYMGLAVFAGRLVRKPGINMLVYPLFCAVTGILIAPLLLIAQVQTGGVQIIYQAFGLTALTFGALTGYVLISGKNFSFMRGMLTTGLFVVLGLILVGFFVQSSAFHLALTCTGLLLFAGFVLYDTSNLLHVLTPDEYIAGAFSLFIDFINMFIRILSLLMSRR